MAPVAAREVEPPAQIVEGEAMAVTVGKGLTVTVTEAVAEHPAPLLPVTT